MPEPITAAEGEQGEQTATAQLESQVDKPENEQQSEGQSSDAALMDLLDIPPELQKQIAPKVEAKEPETTPEPETEEVEGKKKKEEEAKPEEESDEDDAEGEEEDEEKEEPEQKVDKRQKRINRLTRQRSRLESDLADRESKLEEAKARIEKLEKNGQAPQGTVPQVGKWMPDQETAETYTDLSQKKAVAEATLAWCDKYSQGVTITENGQERFVDSSEITNERRKAEIALMEVSPEIKVLEREAKQLFKSKQAEFNGIANQLWPDIAKRDSELHQEAAQILKEFPSIAASPAAFYYVGLAIEGRKAIEAKAAAKNGNGKAAPPRKGDINPKVFTTPRIPIAPHTPEPPTREATSSSTKKLQEAENDFMTDPDGSKESLAKFFQARDAVKQRSSPRSPVKV